MSTPRDPSKADAMHETGAPEWKQPGQGRERRVAPRLSCELPCTVDHDGRMLRGLVTDLSAGGAGLELPEPVELGEVLTLRFELPSGGGVRAAALVRRRDGSGNCGVEFHNISGDDRHSVADWLSSRLDQKDRVGRRRWRGDVGAATLDLEAGRPRLSWHLALPAIAAEVLETLNDSSFVFVPGPSDDLRAGQTIEFELALPFTHVVFRSACEVIWVHTSDLGVSGAGVSLQLPSISEIDRAVLATLVAQWR
jgi:hypothetical protein